MITVIHGSKGTGKTKLILDKANEAIDKAKGNIIYITDNNGYMFQIKRPIRYVAAAEYNIECLSTFIGFIKGMFAANHDIESIFIDGAARIAKAKVEELKPLFELLEAHPEVNFVLTVSANEQELPDFIKRYIN